MLLFQKRLPWIFISIIIVLSLTQPSTGFEENPIEFQPGIQEPILYQPLISGDLTTGWLQTNEQYMTGITFPDLGISNHHSFVQGFRIPLQKGEAVLIRAQSTQFDPILHLWTETGYQRINDNTLHKDTSDATLSFWARKEPQQIYIHLLSTQPAATGGYALEVIPVDPQQILFVPPYYPIHIISEASSFADTAILDPSEGQLMNGNPFHRYQIELERGYQIDMLWEGDIIEPELILEAPDRTRYFFSSDPQPETARIKQTFCTDQQGSWNIYLSGSIAGVSGTFTFKLDWNTVMNTTDIPPIPQSIRYGRLTTDDPTSEYYYVDRTRIHLAQGIEAQIIVKATAFDPYIAVYFPDPSPLYNNDGEEGSTAAEITFQAPRTGSYTIWATTFEPNTLGSYTLEIQGENSIQGILTADDNQLQDGSYYHIHSIRRNRGDTLLIRLTSTELDPYLVVIPPEFSPLFNDDRTLGDRFAEVSWIAPKSGRYELVITSYEPYGTGQYALAYPAYESYAGVLEPADPTYEDGSYYDEIQFSCESGEEVELLVHADFDAYLFVYLPNGERLFNDDYQDGSTDARLQFETTDPGTYRVHINSHLPAETGSYILRKKSSIPGIYSEQVSDIYNKRGMVTEKLSKTDTWLADGSLSDIYRFQVEKGERLDATLLSEEFDGYLIGIDPSGTIIEIDDGSNTMNPFLEDYLIQETGTFCMYVTSYFPEQDGVYTFRWEVLTAVSDSGF